MSQQLFATFYPKTQKLDEPLPRSQRFNQTAEIRRKHSQMKQNNSFRNSHSRNSYKKENNSTYAHDGEIEVYQSCHTFEDDMIMRYERVSRRNGQIDNPYAAMKLKQLGLSSFEGAYQQDKPLRRLDRSSDGISQAKIFSRQGVFKGNSSSLKLERSEMFDDGDDNNSDKSYVSNVVKRQKAQESQMQILSMQTQKKQQQSQQSGELTGITEKRQQYHHHDYPYLITKLNIPNQPSAQEALQLCGHGRNSQIKEDNAQQIVFQEDKPTEESSLFVSINRHFLKKEAGNTNKSGVIPQDHNNNSTTFANSNTTDQPKKTRSIDRIAGIRMRSLSSNSKRLQSTAAPSSNPTTHKFSPFTYQSIMLHSKNYDKLTSFIEGTTTIPQPQFIREPTRQGNTSPMKHTSSIERQSPKRTYLLLGRTREEQFKQIGGGNGRLKGNAIGSGCSMRTEGAKQQLNLLERLQNYSSKARRNNLSNFNNSCNNNIMVETCVNDSHSETRQFRKWHLPKQRYHQPASPTMYSQQNELTGQLADQCI